MNIKIAKVGILKKSDEAIDRMLFKINDGFTGGRITKVDLTSWIIQHFETQALENNLDKIRKDHFDQVTYLESVIKEMKQARKSGATAPAPYPWAPGVVPSGHVISEVVGLRAVTLHPDDLGIGAQTGRSDVSAPSNNSLLNVVLIVRLYFVGT